MQSHTEPSRPSATPGRWKRVPHPSARPGEPHPLTWEETPPVGARVFRSIGVPAALGIAVFIIVLGVTVVVMLQSMQGRGTPVAEQVGFVAPHVATDSGAPDSTLDDTNSAAAHDSERVFVHVAGEVHDPGVVELDAGARVADAITAAGGATPTALLHEVNLARRVVDGEQILVPNTNTLEDIVENARSPGDENGQSGGLLNINLASAADFEQLPRIGPTLAQRVIDWREAHGPFQSIEQLREVEGIGAKTFDDIRALVTL